MAHCCRDKRPSRVRQSSEVQPTFIDECARTTELSPNVCRGKCSPKYNADGSANLNVIEGLATLRGSLRIGQIVQPPGHYAGNGRT